MSNLCENHLWVNGSKKDLALFRRTAAGKDDVICVQNFIPLPENLEKECKRLTKELSEMPDDQKRKVQKRYKLHSSDTTISPSGWAMAHWGTDRVLQETALLEEENGLHFWFLSAWAPPIRAVEKMAVMFPRLHFTLKYAEPDNDYEGMREYEKGKEIDSEDGPYTVGFEEMTFFPSTTNSRGL